MINDRITGKPCYQRTGELGEVKAACAALCANGFDAWVRYPKAAWISVEEEAPPTSTQTPGQRIAAKLKEARDMSALGTMTWKEVAEIIDRELVTIRPEAPQKGTTGAFNAFGDRKAIPPSPEQVTAYSLSIGYPLDGEAWCDCYAQKGWKVGKNRMVDWQSACRNWKRSGYTIGETAKPANKNYGVI